MEHHYRESVLHQAISDIPRHSFLGLANRDSKPFVGLRMALDNFDGVSAKLNSRKADCRDGPIPTSQIASKS
jgi:hypothetical protein